MKLNRFSSDENVSIVDKKWIWFEKITGYKRPDMGVIIFGKLNLKFGKLE